MLLAAAFGGALIFGAQASPSRTATGFGSLSAQAAEARSAGRLDDAKAFYARALALRPSWTEGWWSLGTIQYEQDAYSEAARSFRKVVARDPRNGTAKVMLGLSEFQLGQDESALRNLQEGRRLGVAATPQLQQVMLYHEGVLLQRAGKFERSLEILHSLCLSGIETRSLIETLGMAALLMREKQAAGAAEQTVLRVGRAECLSGAKKYDEARQLYVGVTSENPRHPNLHYAFGRFLLEARDTPGAIEAFKREIANQPAHALARLQIAASLYRTDSAAGLSWAREAVKLDSRIPLGHYLLGLLLLDTDDHLAAIPELEIARDAFPDEGKLHLALGTAYARAGRMEEAARARRTFAALDSKAQKNTLP